MLTTHHTPGPAPEVVLLHGVFMDSGLWHGVTPLLSVATTTVDLPGHGGSAAPRPGATLDDHVLAVEETLERVVAGPVVLAGHSWGGMVGLRLALRRPDLVGALVLVNTPLLRTTGAARLGFRAQRALLAGGLPPRAYGRVAARSLIGREHRAAHPHVVDELAERTARLGRRGVRQVLRSVLLKPQDALADLERLDLPWTAVAGDDDYVLGRGVRERLCATGRLTVVPGAHTSPLEAPAAVATVIGSAAREVVSPRR